MRLRPLRSLGIRSSHIQAIRRPYVGWGIVTLTCGQAAILGVVAVGGFVLLFIRGDTPALSVALAAVNALNRKIQADNNLRRGLKRVDSPHIPKGQIHVHLDDGTSVNQDGSRGHEGGKPGRRLTRDERDFLTRNGWSLIGIIRFEMNLP